MEVNLPDIIKRILEARGITDLEGFLNPTLADLAPPEDLPGIVAAADVILAALADGRKVVVFGDYDCDGVCATAILVRTLETLGALVAPFLPDRQSEGYGMSARSVSRMLDENPAVGLVVTVDNGINSVEPIAELKAKGIAVVVTDHHLPGDTLPAADVVVDPKVMAPESLESLCGAGVAFLLANRLVSEAKRRGVYSGANVGGPLLILAGLATVTDIMPLVGQNRILVSEALKRFHSWAPIGLRELYMRAARSGTDQLTSKDFGFMIGPRINAAGRLATLTDEDHLASGMRALELILAKDREIAREFARLVDDYNRQRKDIEQGMTEEAMAKVVPSAPAQVIDLPDGHPGVAGIVAARVLERLSGTAGPVCVIAGGHGSARSPDGLNIRDAFVACDAVLERYGGHAPACGFSVKEGRVDDFRRMLCEYCASHADALQSVSGPKVDAEVAPADITMELAEAVSRLEPFGIGNEEPVFGLKDVYFADVRPLGSEGKHLSVTLRGSRLRGVWRNRGDLVEPLRAESARPHDIAFTLTVSGYGERHVELRLKSIVESACQ